MAKLDLHQNSMLVQSRPPVLITSSFPMCGYGCPFFPPNIAILMALASARGTNFWTLKKYRHLLLYTILLFCAAVCIEDVTM